MSIAVLIAGESACATGSLGLHENNGQPMTFDLTRRLGCESDQFQPREGSTKQFGWSPATIFC